MRKQDIVSAVLFSALAAFIFSTLPLHSQIQVGAGGGAGGGGTPGGSSLQAQYNNAASFGGMNLWRTGADQTDFSNGTTAEQVRIYNTTDNNGGTPTNSEYAALDWTTTANTLTIKTLKTGTGTNRGIDLVPANSTLRLGIGVTGNNNLSLYYNATLSGQLYTQANGTLTLTNPISGQQLALVSTGAGGTINLGSGNSVYNFTGNTTGTVNFSVGGNAAFQFGSANAASPIAQTVQSQGSRSGTDTNVGGSNLTVTSGNGTGTGTLSSLILQSPIAVGSGTGAQTQTTGLTIKGGTAVLSGYTVATLPASPTTGAMAYVSDAVACTFLATVTGGGSAFCPVVWTGAAWQGA